jgi:hypothetical protein
MLRESGFKKWIYKRRSFLIIHAVYTVLDITGVERGKNGPRRSGKTYSATNVHLKEVLVHDKNRPSEHHLRSGIKR